MNDLQLFEGETFLHLGKKHTFADMAKAVLKELRGVELQCFEIALDLEQKEDWYLIQETEHEAFMEKIRERKEARKN